jgi:hypothetical protein
VHLRAQVRACLRQAKEAAALARQAMGTQRTT